jgi:L-amino acid N-acyltransferase YncA
MCDSSMSTAFNRKKFFYKFEHMIELRPMLPAHSEAVLRIYKEGMDTGNATFTTEVPAWEEWDKTHHSHSRIVAMEGNNIIGWIALLPVSARACYKGVAEFSIYVSAQARGKGVGHLLMTRLIEESEANGMWTLYSATFQENIVSIELQKKFGFRIIGTRELIAQLNGVWRTIVALERRSKKVGVS